MKGLFRILASRSVFAIEPQVGQQLLNAAMMVLNRQATFSADDFKVVASNGYTQKVAVENGETTIMQNIAVMPVYGTMLAEDEMCGSNGTITMSRQMLDLAYNDNINGIVLDIMSPGGQVLGTEEFANSIAIARERKPVVAYINGEAASAAYRIAAEADHIMMNGQAAEVGSIGVMLHYLDLSAKMATEGVREIKVVSNFSPDKNSFNFSDPSEEDLLKIQSEMLDPFCNVFQESVRVLRPEIDKKALSGRMFLADEAIALGMADSIGNFTQALAMAASAEKPQTMFGTKKTDETLKQEHELQLNELTAQHLQQVEQFKEKVYALEGSIESLKAGYESEKADMLATITNLTAKVQELSEAPANEVTDAEGDEGTVNQDAVDTITAAKLPWSGFASERLK